MSILISQKTINFFKQTTPQLDYQLHFQDFTDNQVRKAYTACGLLDYLYEHATDNEVKAHITGFKDYAHRRNALMRCAAIIASHDAETKEQLQTWWNTYADPDNPLTETEVQTIWRKQHGTDIC